MLLLHLPLETYDFTGFCVSAAAQETDNPENAGAAASSAAKQGSTPAIVTSTVTSATIVSASGIAAASAVITVCSS